MSVPPSGRMPRYSRTRTALALLSALTCGLLLVACGGGATAPAAAPAAPAPAPAPPAAGSPAGTPDDRSAAWDATVAAAKREGRLAVSVTTGQLFREALLPFAEEYPEIQLELTGGSPPEFWPRVHQERATGQYLWDLRVAGFGSLEHQARAEGVLDPVRPVLMLPEVADDSKWFGGLDGRFFDQDRQYLFGMFAVAQNNLRVNRDVIPETELRTPRDLVDPRWKGQIVLQDPRSGSGTAVLGSFLVAYGEDLVRDILGKQEVVVTRDTRQQVEWVVRGRYPIGIGVVPRDLAIFRQQGLGLDVRSVREPATILTSSGGIMLLNRAPHPNAAKVFINWMLTRDAQSRITQKLGEYNSARLDVPPVDPESYPDPARLNEYINTQSETILPQLQRAESLAKELLP